MAAAPHTPAKSRMRTLPAQFVQMEQPAVERHLYLAVSSRWPWLARASKGPKQPLRNAKPDPPTSRHERPMDVAIFRMAPTMLVPLLLRQMVAL